MKMSFK